MGCYCVTHSHLSEDDRALILMLEHRPLPGETSICRCGYVGYSTPGYLLHLYRVVALHAQRPYPEVQDDTPASGGTP